MQISSAFTQVHSSLSWVVNAYLGISDLMAVVLRLKELENTIDKIKELKKIITIFITKSG